MVAEMECLQKEMGLSGADGREEITAALSQEPEGETIARESAVTTS